MERKAEWEIREREKYKGRDKGKEGDSERERKV